MKKNEELLRKVVAAYKEIDSTNEIWDIEFNVRYRDAFHLANGIAKLYIQELNEFKKYKQWRVFRRFVHPKYFTLDGDLRHWIENGDAEQVFDKVFEKYKLKMNRNALWRQWRYYVLSFEGVAEDEINKLDHKLLSQKEINKSNMDCQKQGFRKGI
eukprot:271063_1